MVVYRKKCNSNDLNISQLFDTYKTDVFRFALSITRDVYLSEDITQDVFLKLIQNINQIEDAAKIKSWLLTTTKNLTLNIMRKRSFEMCETYESLSVKEDNYQSDFFSMLDCLDETEQQIVVLHIVNGLKHKEIAQIMDMKPGTVRQRYARSLKLIKQTLIEGNQNLKPQKESCGYK